MPDRVSSAAFIAECRSLLGVPWHHCGRNKYGVDCSGLPVLALKRLGIEVDVPEHYSKSDEMQAMITAIETGARKVKRIRAGDLLVFRNESVGARCHMLNHLGVATGENSFVHAWETKGRVCETPLDDFWKRSVFAIYRLRCIKWLP